MRSLLTVTTLACAFALSACASSGEPKPKEPIRLDMRVNALPDANPDDRGRAAPIVVRIYELKSDGAFESADFFTLQTQDKTVLADDVVKRDELQLRPGEHQTLVRRPDPATKTIGVIAAYRDLPNTVWRAVYAMPAAPDKAWYRLFTPKLKLTIDIEAKAVRITEAKK
ncbi:membrane protein [Burkholderia lata]|uniref:type VI secretion system lipoprotein TssJ n=1 Tax=Burkholderia TaxID=32008 RepID=UPI001453E4B4|nr:MULTISPECIES: type VI secretion system lipoprotein TssJ [Burkholderia]MBN3775992.1 type VI secretion system lipoprotein TssJ [Burkholderia sp. Ac-20345]VWB36013.1 membrane protein [Burkholderia lata]VWC59353.1 membrane protein [Burkholderia lata]